MDYINYLNHPIYNILVNIFLIIPLLFISFSKSFTSNKLFSFNLMISVSLNILLLNIFAVALTILKLGYLITLIPILLYLILIKFYFSKKLFLFKNFIKIKLILIDDWKKNKLILITLLLLGLCSQLTALDSDSFLYHLGYPFKLIQNNFSYENLSWYHLNLLSYGEINNLYGLLFKTDTFVSSLNFIYFFILYLYVSEICIIKSYKLKIIFFSFPIFYFFIASQKFFFVPTVIILIFISYNILIENKFKITNYLIFYFAIFTKFTFFLFPIIFYFYQILLKLNFKNFLKCTKINLISLLPIFSLFLIFRIYHTNHPFFPFFIENTIDKVIFLDWIIQMTNFLNFSFLNFFNLIVPSSFEGITNFLGVSFIFVIFLIYRNDFLSKIFIITLICSAIIFFQTSARFYFIIFFLSILLYINKYNFVFKNILYENVILKSFSIAQIFILISLCFYSILVFGKSIYSENGRLEILSKYGYDFKGISEINTFINKKNLDLNYIFISRSNIFAKDKFISYELTSTVLSEKKIIFYSIFDEYIKINKINSILIKKDVFDSFPFLNCIKDEEIYQTKHILSSSRNPFNNSEVKYVLFSLKNDISNCY